MAALITALSQPWPWYVAGPLIGLMVPLMMWLGSRSFGISQNLEHLCAMTQPSRIGIDFFRYDWRQASWSLWFAIGAVLGGFLAGVVFSHTGPMTLSPAARGMFAAWGAGPEGYALLPDELFALTPRNVVLLTGGGVLVGFGARYASGCTSGHAITGLATLQPQSLIAVAGMFAGGMLASHFIVPLVVG